VRAIAIASVAGAFLALSGIAFAWGGGGGCHGSFDGGCQPPGDLVWVNPNSEVPSATWVGCTISHSQSTLTVAISGLTPGASCSFKGTLENTGKSSDELVAHISASEPSRCRLFVYADNLIGVTHPPSLSPNHTFGYSGKISLGPTAADGCLGASASFVVTITSSGESSCEGFLYGLEYGSDGNDGCCH